jgi:ribosomal protein L33
MSQDTLVKIQNKATKTIIWTKRPKKSKITGVPRKLDLKKYDKVTRKHVTFKEIKK